MYKKLLPSGIKNRFKEKIKSSLFLVPERDFNIAHKLASRGVDNFIDFSYQDLKTEVLNYVDAMQTDAFSYKYCSSVHKSNLYNSIYACMLKGIFGEIEQLNAETKLAWADFLNTHQDEDGYFRDNSLNGVEFETDGLWGDGWGKNHLMGHIIIAFARLGHTPKFTFNFLKPYYNDAYVSNWLEKFDFSSNVWSQSNYIMNLVTLLQYSRDYMNDHKAQNPITTILNWLRQAQRKDTGMWHTYDLNSYHNKADAIRGAYHFYPLFFYEKETLPYGENIIDVILSTQNSWGGFEDEKKPAGACEDIDALDPLIRFSLHTDHRTVEVKKAVKKAMVWYLASHNDSGGFEFMIETPNEYGKHPLTSSKINEANMFATWFRTLGLAYILEYLDIENQFHLGVYPGYEINLGHHVKK